SSLLSIPVHCGELYDILTIRPSQKVQVGQWHSKQEQPHMKSLQRTVYIHLKSTLSSGLVKEKEKIYEQYSTIPDNASLDNSVFLKWLGQLMNERISEHATNNSASQLCITVDFTTIQQTNEEQQLT